jgi:hypothetical protein
VIHEVLSGILAQHVVQDVSVEDPPLEEVIAAMFTLTNVEEPEHPQLAPATE